MLKSIKSKLFVNLIFFILLFITGTYIINFMDKQRRDYSLKVQSKLIESKYRTNYKNFKMMTNEFARMYQKKKELIQLLFLANNADENESKIIREELYNLVLKNYEHLSIIGVSQVHFYLKNDRSFLRMNKPEYFGDVSLKIERDVIRTNTENPLQEGFKVSKFTTGVAFAYPLFDEYNQYIGSVAITYSTRQLIENILDSFSYDAHLLVSNKKQDMMYENSWEIPEYRLESSSHKAMKIINLYHTLKSASLQKSISDALNTKQPFSLHKLHDYTNVILTFLPLKQWYGSQNSAYLVLYTESNYLQELIRENKYLLIIFYTIVFILFIFVSYIFINKEKFEKLALYDNVTKLPNRTLFLIELDNEINRAIRSKSKLAVLFIDLDGFKAVNDTYGHKVGDDLLVHAGNTFSAEIRKSDTVARIGGDEFVIILTDINEISQSVEIASKIIKSISNPVSMKNNHIQIGASIGISIYPDHAEDTEELLKLADSMMYVSKKAGKNRVTLFEVKS